MNTFYSIILFKVYKKLERSPPEGQCHERYCERPVRGEQQPSGNRIRKVRYLGTGGMETTVKQVERTLNRLDEEHKNKLAEHDIKG